MLKFFLTYCFFYRILVYISVNETDPQNREKVFKYSTLMERNKLFVKGLPYKATKESIQELFGQFGEIKDVRIVTHRNGHSKGIAYVDFVNDSEASKAIVKVPFIYYVSIFIAQNLIWFPKFSQKLFFFRQNIRISISTLHFDEILMQ